MLRCAIPIFLSLISHALFAQNSKLDSLSAALEHHSQKDTIRFRLLITAGEYLYASPVKSKDYLKEALDLALELEFRKGVAEAYCSLAYYFWNRTDYPPAIEYCLLSLKEYEKIKYAKGQYGAYNILAGIYVSMKEFKEAEGYMQKMLELGKRDEGLIDYGTLYYNMGFLKMKQTQFKEGLELVNDALTIFVKKNEVIWQAQCYFFMASAKQELGEYEESIRYLKNCIRLTKLSNHPYSLGSLTSAHEAIGGIYIKLSRFDKALLHLDTAFNAARQIENQNTIIDIYRVLALLHEARGNFKEALKYERLHKAMNDSVLNKEKSKQLADSQTRYETEKKEQTIALLNQEKKFQNKLTGFLASGIALLGLSAITIFLLQRSRTRKAKELLAVQESLNTKLVEVDKTKSRFFANISHEFRTPLTLILGPIEEKLTTDKLDDKDKFTFQAIKRNSNRLLELVNQLLELSKLESGNMNLKLESGNLKDALLSIISSFDSLADVNQVRYLKDVHMAEAIVLFDRDKLEKILSNLLSNAFKFTPQAGLIEFIGTTSEKGATTELQLKIRNTGPMISTEMLNKIFEPFFQGENAAYRGIQGTGLGLSLVRELVKLHRGTVEVSSDEKGTVFTVLLKFENSLQRIDTVEQVEFVHRPIISTEEMVDSRDDLSIEENGKDTVLIVEDNADVRAFIRRGLESSYHILEAPHGEAGLHLANEQIPHLIIADVMMPKMSGIDLCYQLKNNEKTSHIPVIMLTARADHESKLEGLKTGADDYLIKPFNPEELVVRVNNLIEQRKRLAQKYNQKLIVQPHEIAVSSLDERFIQKIIKVVETHLDDTQLSVDIVTTELGISRTNLHKKLKAITGLATSEFIQDFRLRRAAQLIDKKTDNFAQIAFQVGFADQSYFTKCFKKKFDKTPSEYANLQQEN